MSNQTLFLHTRFGIFNKNAVAYVKVGEQGDTAVYISGVNDPILLKSEEAAKLIKVLVPIVDIT